MLIEGCISENPSSFLLPLTHLNHQLTNMKSNIKKDKSSIAMVALLTGLTLCPVHVWATPSANGIDAKEVNQQSGRVTGTVVDDNGQPVLGATVRVLGRQNLNAVTDMDGRFSINAPEGSTLEVSYIGYKVQTVRIGTRTSIKVKLEEDSKSLSDVVVVGYGSQLRRQVTGAISSVKAADIQAPNAVSADNLLQGKVAGLAITQNSAQPGSGMNVNIRGSLSPNGSNAPLYVIDGVVVSSNSSKAAKVGPSRMLDYALRDGSDRSPLATLNPDDIASIDVLKDASAAAIYGSQAANGVILITTKKGQSGTPRVNYSASLSVQGISKYYDMLNAKEFMEMANLGEKEQWLYDHNYAPYTNTPAPSSGWPIVYSDKEIAQQTESYNHFDDIKRTGIINDHNISVSMGTDKLKLYSSFNYFNQNSVLKTTSLRRYSGRINLEYRFTKWLKFSSSNMYTVIYANNPSMGHWRENANEANYTNAALYFSPRLPLVQDDGTLTLPENALSMNPKKFELIKDKTTTKRLFFAPNLEVQFTPWLKGNVQLSVDETSEMRDVFSPKAARMPQQNQENYGGYSNAYNNNYGIEEYLTFDKRFGSDHYLNAVVGSGYYKAKGNNYSFCVFNLPTDVLENNALQLSSDAEDTQYNSNRWERNKLSFFGRLSYTYLDRYILGATLRHDGSSAFAENHKWGWFPGVSAGWIISNEGFMKDAKWLDYLKLRAGYGTSGNESILTGNLYMLTTYGTASSGGWYYFNNTKSNAIIQTVKGNKDLKWETDKTFNIGIDMTAFNNRLSASLDFYVRTAQDLLDFATLPMNDVVYRIAKNVGKTRSKGVELAVKGTMIQTKEWNWNAYLNLSHNKSYWVERNPEVDINPWVGEHDELTAFYGWKTDGIFHSLDEVQQWKSNGKVLQPNAYPGNLRYVDQNGDGVMDDKDIVKLGTYEPAVRFGLGTSLTYKNWNLEVDTYGNIGQKTYNGWHYRSFIGNSKINSSTHVYERWASFNTNGWYPGLAADVTGNNNKSGSNDFTLQNTSYLRFKNIKLTYNLPKETVARWGMSNLGVYVDLQNTLLLTNYEGLDPEMEQNAAPFPIPSTVVFGLNVTF